MVCHLQSYLLFLCSLLCRCGTCAKRLYKVRILLSHIAITYKEFYHSLVFVVIANILMLIMFLFIYHYFIYNVNIIVCKWCVITMMIFISSELWIIFIMKSSSTQRQLYLSCYTSYLMILYYYYDCFISYIYVLYVI